jgi:hypothetical protein
MLRPTTTVVLCILLAGCVAACGDDDTAPADPPAARERSRAPHVTLSEARRLLESGGIELTGQGLDGTADIAQEIRPRPAKARRLTTQRGPKLDLLVFATPAKARRAWSSILGTEVIEEGGAAMRAANVVAVFPRPADGGFYARIKARLRALAVACGERGGDPELRQICRARGGGVPPAGAGTDGDELAPIGTAVHVGDVVYDVVMARQLNPRIAPDEDLVAGRTAGEGALLFGVFVRACNRSDGPAAVTDRFAIVNAFGRETRPESLSRHNAFALRSERLPAGSCAPEPGSAAARTADGGLVLFELPTDRIDERPLGLRIVSPDGTESATVRLDV